MIIVHADTLIHIITCMYHDHRTHMYYVQTAFFVSRFFAKKVWGPRMGHVLRQLQECQLVRREDVTNVLRDVTWAGGQVERFEYIPIVPPSTISSRNGGKPVLGINLRTSCATERTTTSCKTCNTKPENFLSWLHPLALLARGLFTLTRIFGQNPVLSGATERVADFL